MEYETSVDVTITIDDDKIISYVQRFLFPEQVYGREDLESWAEHNGYVKAKASDE